MSGRVSPTGRSRGLIFTEGRPRRTMLPAPTPTPTPTPAPAPAPAPRNDHDRSASVRAMPTVDDRAHDAGSLRVAPSDGVHPHHKAATARRAHARWRAELPDGNSILTLAGAKTAGHSGFWWASAGRQGGSHAA